MFKLTTLNLNGLRAAMRKGLADWLAMHSPDCMCVQELKAQAADVEGVFDAVSGLKGFFHYAQTKGYSGVGIYTRQEPSEVIRGFDGGEFDAEGRCIELRFDTLHDKRSILSVYFPSGSSGDPRQEAKYRFLDRIAEHLQSLQSQGRSMILCADVNIAHHEKDLKNWKGNLKNSGFLPQERAWLTQLLNEKGWVDVFRQLDPEATETAYTWWSQRGQAYAKNVGWRIDYHLATRDWAPKAQSAFVDKQHRLSDHAPLTITYKRH